jgi:hypothetical protein
MPHLLAEIAHRIDPSRIETLDVTGPTVQFLTPVEDDAPCIMRGTIPPGVVIPVHSHPEPETFIAIEGELEGLSETPEGSIGSASDRAMCSTCRVAPSTPGETARGSRRRRSS